MAEENTLIGLINQTESIAKEKREKAREKEEEAKRASDIASRVERGIEQIISQLLRTYQGSQQKLIQGYNSVGPWLELANVLAEYDPANAKQVLNLASEYRSKIEKDFGSAADTEYALTSWWLSRQLNELQQARNAVTEMRKSFDDIYKEITKKLSKENKG